MDALADSCRMDGRLVDRLVDFMHLELELSPDLGAHLMIITLWQLYRAGGYSVEESLADIGKVYRSVGAVDMPGRLQ